MVEKSRFSVKLSYDSNPVNPRSNENRGKMICWSDKYNLGDKHSFQNEKELIESLMLHADITPDEIGVNMDNFYGEKAKIIDELRNHIAIAPLYIYDGEYPDLTCADERLGKDGEFVGYIFMDADQLEENYGSCNKSAIMQGLIDILGELDTYGHYVYGDNFKMQILKDDKEFAEISGFTGNLYDDVIPEMKKAASESLAEEKVSSEQVNDMFGVDSPQIISDKSYENAPRLEVDNIEEEI